MLRLCDNPPARWPLDRPLSDDVGHWCVARVKPRHEKALAHDLARIGVGYYLPMMTRRTVRKDNHKPRKSVVVLFPGYISLSGYEERRAEIIKSGRVAGIIAVADHDRFVAELDGVRRALDCSEMVGIHPLLASGRRVRIISGPLRGLEGVIEDCRRPARVHLNVEMFNRSVSVSAMPEELLPI